MKTAIVALQAAQIATTRKTNDVSPSLRCPCVVRSPASRIAEPVGRVLRFPGHWTYQPSVVLPSPETQGKFVLVFASNYVARKDGTSQFSDNLTDHNKAVNQHQRRQ